MENKYISSIFAHGLEVDMLADGSYVKINLRKSNLSLYPYLVARYTPASKGKLPYYEIIHTTRRSLAQINPSMEEDILWYMYKEFLYESFNSVDRNTFTVEPISELDVIGLIDKLYEYDKALVPLLINKYENIRKYTRMYK